MAFRKTNKMSRSFNATPDIFRTLADGKGGFNLKYPGAGRHVEVDISRQVMVLADNGKAQYVFHVSTGAPATPSDKGDVPLLPQGPRLQPVGMYYSVYYNRGEATHGYKSVPAVQRQPRLHPQPDPELGLHLQLDQPREHDARLQLGP